MILIYNTCEASWPEALMGELIGEATFLVLEDIGTPDTRNTYDVIIAEDFVDLQRNNLDKAMAYQEYLLKNKEKVIVFGVSEIFKSTINLNDILRFAREKINERK